MRRRMFYSQFYCSMDILTVQDRGMPLYWDSIELLIRTKK